MPAIDVYLPQQTPKQLEKRVQKSARVMRYLAMTEPARIAVGLRQETRVLRKQFEDWAELGTCGYEACCTIAKTLNGHRALMLDLIGLPKRPGRAIVSEKLAREIRDSIPAEIEVPEPGPEPPTEPPAP